MTFRMNFCFLLSISCILLNTYVNSAEFVPVYMWTTQTKISNHVPALHKISADSFKEVMLDYLKTNPYVVVFTEQTLSPEDFAQRDQNGNTLYPNLSNLKESTIVSYLPYVQNPIKSLKHLNKEFTETSIEQFNNDLPKDTILIINLNDAEDNEDRTDMLKRHDLSINSIFKDISKKYDNVLVLYTARHTSWVAPEDVPHQRQTRSLLATEPAEKPAITLMHGDAIVFYAKEIIYNNETQTPTLSEANSNDTLYVIKSTNPTFELSFSSTMSGYWVLTNVTINGQNATFSSDFAAPFRFSYHCTNQTFKSKVTTDVLSLGEFQVQPWFEGKARANQTQFGDAYDCVGFTSVPIWSGIFITFILLLILTAGITMMIDIKTMDRFDDPKGKTITINASE